jgi:hypothetical protein
MSYETGMKVLNLEDSPRVGRVEYCFHNELIKEVTGIKPGQGSKEDRKKAQQLWQKWANYDFIWTVKYKLKPWEQIGRKTDMGHAVYQEDGSDYSAQRNEAFRTIDEVLAFDAQKEYGIFSDEQLIAHFNSRYKTMQSNFSSVVVPGGYYDTLISGMIHTFGWDMLLTALGTDAKTMGEKVMESYYELTLQTMKCFAQTDIKCFIAHDDMVWTQGPFYNPQWYRKYIFPRYEKLWQPLKEKGIKVLYCCDGNFNEFIDDLAQTGVDGFIFEPVTSLETIAQKYGKTHVIMGNVDSRILTFGTKDEIKKEVDRCLKIGKDCPGYFLVAGNHIPPNIPLDNAKYYFDYVNENMWR